MRIHHVNGVKDEDRIENLELGSPAAVGHQGPGCSRLGTRDPRSVRRSSGQLHVVSGRMRLLLGEDDLVIEPGEAVEFVTTTPHWFGAVDDALEVIAIFGPHGDRAHVHG